MVGVQIFENELVKLTGDIFDRISIQNLPVVAAFVALVEDADIASFRTLDILKHTLWIAPTATHVAK